MRATFGAFTLDGDTRTLAAGARVLHLSPKAFDLLQLLVERRPAVVVKEEIAARIWPGVSVSDTSLGGLVKEIRRALGDDAAEPTFIRTVHRVGYAFIGDVEGGAPPAPPQGSYRCWLTWNDKTLSLAPGENVLGRDPRCAVWIEASGVSRRHARVVVGPSATTIEDLESRNGTVVGNEAVTTARRLGNGDRIAVGVATLTFHEWAEDRAPLTERIVPGRGDRSAARGKR